MAVGELLDAVLAAAKAGDWEGAVAPALEAWRVCPCAEIAEAIEAIDESFISDRDAVIPRGTLDETFSAYERAGRARDVRPLIEYFMARAKTYPAATTFIATLAARRGRDPRLASALINLVRHPPFYRQAPDLYSQVFAGLVAMADPRTVAEVLELSQPHRGKRTVVPFIGGRGMADLHKAADSMAALSSPRIEASIASRCQTIIAALRSRARRPDSVDGEAELLAAIYASPADLSLRQVYADLLIERGDPRGEFIALQCGRLASGARPTRRERELQKTHERAWLGAIAPFVMIGGLEWKAGFVSAVRFSGGASVETPIGDPTWTTVESFDARSWVHGVAPLLLHPSLRALRSVRGLDPLAFEELCSHREPLEWTHLEVANLRAVRPGAGPFAKLTSLIVFDKGAREADVSHLFSTPFGQRLERLRLTVRGASWHAFRALAEKAPARLRVLELVERTKKDGYRDWLATMTRDEAGRFTSLEAHFGKRSGSGPVNAPLFAGLRSFARDSLDRLVIRPGSAARKNAETLDSELRALVAERFASADFELSD